MSNPTFCEHKWVFLRNEGTRETGYRRWVQVDRFFCEKCLKQQVIETEDSKGMDFRTK